MNFSYLMCVDWDAFVESPMWVSITTGIVGILVVAFVKAVARVFRMGATFKAELATKEELDRFKAEMRAEERAYREDLAKTILNSCLKIIDERLKDVSMLTQTAIEMKEMKATMVEQIKNLEEKISTINNLNENVRILNNKMIKYEYGVTSPEVRRTEDS